MKTTVLASLATISLTGSVIFIPGMAHAAQLEAVSETPEAAMGPVEDYQYGLTVNGVAPTLRSVVVDGESILAYCIEYWVQAADPDHTSGVTGWDEFTGDNNFKTDPQVRERVAWILRNSHPTVSLDQLAEQLEIQDLSEAEAVAATQAAIWHFTDDFVPEKTLTVDSAANNSEPVSEQSAQNVQTLFDYFTGPDNTGLSEQEVQASVTLVDATDAEGETPEQLEQRLEDEHDQLLGPIELNASTDDVDLTLTATDAAVDIAGLGILDAAGAEMDVEQPVNAEELWVHVPATTDTGGLHIEAESTEFGYTGRLITPEPDEQRRFQTIVLVDEASHHASTELAVDWEASQQDPPPEPENPPAPPQPPVEEPPVEEPPVEEPPVEEPPVEEPPVKEPENEQPEQPPLEEPTPPVETPEPEIEEVQEIVEPKPTPSEEPTVPVEHEPVEAAPELAETGPHQTRNILIALGTLGVGAALLVVNKIVRAKAARRQF